MSLRRMELNSRSPMTGLIRPQLAPDHVRAAKLVLYDVTLKPICGHSFEAVG